MFEDDASEAEDFKNSGKAGGGGGGNRLELTIDSVDLLVPEEMANDSCDPEMELMLRFDGLLDPMNGFLDINSVP